jgi:hypothetical protein
LPEHVAQLRPKLEKWAEIIATGSVDAHKGQEILGDFINDVFCELLGCVRAVDNPKRYTISREKHVQANGRFADAVLGEFGAEESRIWGRSAAERERDRIPGSKTPKQVDPRSMRRSTVCWPPISTSGQRNVTYRRGIFNAGTRGNRRDRLTRHRSNPDVEGTALAK